MKSLLMQCYAESGIIGANEELIQKRINALSRIIKGAVITETEYKRLAEWMLGIEHKGINNILFKLELSFILDDESFSLDHVKELQVLVAFLVYLYSRENGIWGLPLFIICGCHAGHMIASPYMYSLFVKCLDEMRLKIRHAEEDVDVDYDIGIYELKDEIVKEEKRAREDGENFCCTEALARSIVDILENCELALQDFDARERYLLNELKVQKEESNIAWWLLNEWSNSYDRPLSELQSGEIVLAIPIDLRKLIQFSIGPYAIKQVIYKGISLAKTHQDIISLVDLVIAVKSNLGQMIDIENMAVGEVQPILMALKCAYECRDSSDEQAWKIIFNTRCHRGVEDLQMDMREMAYQIYLELELAEYLED